MAYRTNVMPVCWLVSLALHALACGSLFVQPATPVTVSRPVPAAETSGTPEAGPDHGPASAPPPPATPAEILSSLQAARRELADLETAKREEFRRNTRAADISPDDIATAQRAAAKAQTAALEALKHDTDDAGVFSAAASEAQAQQAKALDALARSETNLQDVYHAQAAANSAQLRASQLRAEAESLRAEADSIRVKNAPVENRLAEARTLLDTTERQLAAARDTATRLTESLPALDAAAANAKASLESAEKARVSAAKKAFSAAQKTAADTRKNLVRAQNEIAKLEKRLTEQNARVAKFSGSQTRFTDDSAALARAATEKQSAAGAAMAEALALQDRAARELASARAGASPDKPAPSANTQPGSPADLYRTVVETEKDIVESYRRLKATDLALRRDISLTRALELTDSAHTQRPDLSSSFAGSDAGASGEAQNQISAIHSLSESILEQARSLEAGTGRRLDLERLATEDENQRAKDLTLAMQGSGSGQKGSGLPASSGSPGGNGNGSGSGLSSGGGGFSDGVNYGDGAGSGGGSGPRSAPPALPKTIDAAPGRVVGPGMASGRWRFVDSWYLIGPFENEGRANIDKQFPPESVIDLDATYVGKRGRPVRWEFHQSPSPCVIPPFDTYNPLPDNATGHAFETRGLEYIVYYAYTEIRATADCDVWIAVGSDDFSKLWIGDQLVWASGKKHKSWRLDEGYRKVHLKRGINRALLRVENGHSRTEFSLLIGAP